MIVGERDSIIVVDFAFHVFSKVFDGGVVLDEMGSCLEDGIYVVSLKLLPLMINIPLRYFLNTHYEFTLLCLFKDFFDFIIII